MESITKEVKKYDNGDIYEGGMKDGKKEGFGKLTCANGDIYEGSWENNQRNGKGKYTYASGAYYIGFWKNDKKDGEGTFSWTDGSVYQGDWKNGVPEGFGIWVNAKGCRYKGEWKNGKMDGKGQYSYSEEKYYIGEWKEGKKEGKGKFVYEDGRIYQGEWKNDDIIIGRGGFISPENNKKEQSKTIQKEINKVDRNEKEEFVPIDYSIYTREKETYYSENGHEIDDQYLDSLAYNKLGTPINEWQIRKKVAGYKNDELSQKEEEEFNEKTAINYYARLDTYYKTEDDNYYNKYYISKEKIMIDREEGAFGEDGLYYSPNELRALGLPKFISMRQIPRSVLEQFEDGTMIIYYETPIARLIDDKDESKQIEEYKHNVLLRRKFEFDPLRIYNLYIADEDFYKNGGFDEFLIKILQDRKNDEKAKDIITSIQAKQNAIITAEANIGFIVQGCAGSGKTMVLLQRLSYLKYNDKLPDYKRIKIITPNVLFSDFIEDVTTELDIEEIEQLTMDEYYLHLNQLYVNRYNKLGNGNGAQIEESYYVDHKDRFTDKFYTSKLVDEREVLGEKIAEIYSKQMLETIKNEYHVLVKFIEQELKKRNIRIEQDFSNKQTYYEYAIKEITRKIEEYMGKKKHIEKSEKENREKIKSINKTLDLLQVEGKENSKIAEEINIRNEKTKQRKEKNEATIMQYKEILQPDDEKISNLKAEQDKLIKELTQKRNEITSLQNVDENINALNERINKLNSERTENEIKLAEVKNRWNTINRKRQSERTRGLFFSAERKKLLAKQYGEMLDVEQVKMDEIQERIDQIKEEQNERAKEKNNLIAIRENGNTTERINELNQQIDEIRSRGNEVKRSIDEIHQKCAKTKRRLEKREALVGKYNEILNNGQKQIEYFKSREGKIPEEQKENIGKKAELEKNIKKYVKEAAEMQEKISEYAGLKKYILKNIFFTFDIYEKIMPMIREAYDFSVSTNEYMKIDLFVLLYINYLHIGNLVNGEKFLCVDEAQDYSEVEIELLNQVNSDVVINLYGDINQSIYANGINDWENLKNILNLKLIKLEENYRNPQEINDYCNEKFGFSYFGTGVSTKAVEKIKEAQINDIIKEKIKQKQRIAIISKEKISKKVNSKYVIYGNIQDVKGIEYNTVIAIDKDMTNNEKYIAYTRALSELYIVEE